MRVLVYEPHHVGHFLKYVRHLLPTLVDLVDEPIFSTTLRTRRSESFRESIDRYAGGVRIDVDPTVPNLDGGRRFLRYRDLACHYVSTVRRLEPDHILVPSGDQLVVAAAARPLLGNRRFFELQGDVGIHTGPYRPGKGMVRRARDVFFRRVYDRSPWTQHVVSWLQYRRMKESIGEVRFLPDPIEPIASVPTREARESLGIPVEGRYTVVAGMLDRRKDIPAVLSAFRRVATPDDRLLLAGKMDGGHRGLVETAHSDLMRRGRLILIDRRLTRTEYEHALRSADLVCVPYPRVRNLSGVVLEAVAAGRPVLASKVGWSGWIVPLVGLGRTTDFEDLDRLTTDLAAALEVAEDHLETEATRRLLRFHDPSNYVRNFLADLANRVGRKVGGEPYPWERVLEAPAGAPS